MTTATKAPPSARQAAEARARQAGDAQEAIDSEAARRTVWLSMSFNRQIMAGAPAARLMARVANFPENAEVLMAPSTDEAAPAPQTPPEAPRTDQRQGCNTF